MDCRNSKGQILLEAVFLVTVIITLLIVFQGLIERHRSEIKRSKLSQENVKTLYKGSHETN